jgi:hypothetical protein
MTIERPGTTIERPGTTVEGPGTTIKRPGTTIKRLGTTIERPGTATERPVATAREWGEAGSNGGASPLPAGERARVRGNHRQPPSNSPRGTGER